MTSTVIARSIVVVVSVLQFLGLLMQWPNVKWLSLYVPLLEACIYFAGIVVPGNGSIMLNNGVQLPLMKYCGWLVTVPVLLLQLCRLPNKFKDRSDKTSALIVENQLMLTFGLGSSALGNSVSGCILFVIATLIGLKLYFRVFEICKLTILEMDHPKAYERHKFVIKFLFFIFYLSWSLFPLSQFLYSILNNINEKDDLVIHVIADLISKNMFGLVLCYYVHKLKPDVINKEEYIKKYNLNLIENNKFNNKINNKFNNYVDDISIVVDDSNLKHIRKNKPFDLNVEIPQNNSVSNNDINTNLSINENNLKPSLIASINNDINTYNPDIYSPNTNRINRFSQDFNKMQLQALQQKSINNDSSYTIT